MYTMIVYSDSNYLNVYYFKIIYDFLLVTARLQIVHFLIDLLVMIEKFKLFCCSSLHDIMLDYLDTMPVQIWNSLFKFLIDCYA